MQVLLGLEHLHSHDIIYRDLKEFHFVTCFEYFFELFFTWNYAWMYVCPLICICVCLSLKICCSTAVVTFASPISVIINMFVFTEYFAKLVPGFAKAGIDEHSSTHTFCGTVQCTDNYIYTYEAWLVILVDMAPEIVQNTGHGKPADWFFRFNFYL